jgi:hypothetical protein
LLYKNPEDGGKDYTAEIHFVSKESWDADIATFVENPKVKIHYIRSKGL